MAFPTILISSTDGSDSAASGAGPATALTGSAAATSSDGLTVTLDGTPDLTNVAVDGSHVIYLVDTTAGNRNFSAITAKDTGAYTVTVVTGQAFGVNLTDKSWAIGGKRASIGSTSSRKLVENNGGNGDAMPGWTIGLEGGHSETLSAVLNLRRGGDETSGPITIKGLGDPMPILIQNGSANGIAVINSYYSFEYIRLRRSASAGNGAFSLTGNLLRFYRVWVDGSLNAWSTGIYGSSSFPVHIERCRVETVSSIAYGTGGGMVVGCFARNCSVGVTCSSGSQSVIGSVILNATTGAIRSEDYSTDRIYFANTLSNATPGSSSGILYQVSSAATQNRGWIANNIINGFNTGVTVYGTSPRSATALVARTITFDHNLFYNNNATVTSGYESLLKNSITSVDPAFADPTTTYDLTPGSAVAELGWPDYALDGTATRSYVDLGMVQRRGSAASAGLPASRLITGM